MIELPLGVTITAGPDNKWASGIFVFSDPDGDGIYDHRLMKDVKDGTKLGIVPVEEAGPFHDDSTATYDNQFYWSYGRNWFEQNSFKGYHILTTDYLVKSFGPNTLLEFWDDEREARQYYLLTGEERPESMAYNKLEDYGLSFTTFGNLMSNWAVDPVNAAEKANLFPYNVEIEHNNDLRGKITRGQFASVAVRLYKAMAKEELTLSEDYPFPDVTKDHQFHGSIATAYELGIVGGMPDGAFAPDALITREQALKITVEMLNNLEVK